jgi:hypothetical protein
LEPKLRADNRRRLKDTLGEAFEQASRAGEELSLEDACDLALDRIDPR